MPGEELTMPHIVDTQSPFVDGRLDGDSWQNCDTCPRADAKLRFTNYPGCGGSNPLCWDRFWDPHTKLSFRVHWADNQFEGGECAGVWREDMRYSHTGVSETYLPTTVGACGKTTQLSEGVKDSTWCLHTLSAPNPTGNQRKTSLADGTKVWTTLSARDKVGWYRSMTVPFTIDGTAVEVGPRSPDGFPTYQLTDGWSYRTPGTKTGGGGATNRLPDRSVNAQLWSHERAPGLLRPWPRSGPYGAFGSRSGSASTNPPPIGTYTQCAEGAKCTLGDQNFLSLEENVHITGVFLADMDGFDALPVERLLAAGPKLQIDLKDPHSGVRDCSVKSLNDASEKDCQPRSPSYRYAGNGGVWENTEGMGLSVGTHLMHHLSQNYAGYGPRTEKWQVRVDETPPHVAPAAGLTGRVVIGAHGSGTTDWGVSRFGIHSGNGHVSQNIGKWGEQPQDVFLPRSTEVRMKYGDTFDDPETQRCVNSDCKLWQYRVEFRVRHPKYPDSTYAIRAADAAQYIQTLGGSNFGAFASLAGCGTTNALTGCRWTMTASTSRAGHYFIKVSDANLYLKNVAGIAKMGTCNTAQDVADCQWEFEDSPTREDRFYIKTAGSAKYLRADRNASGSLIQVVACPKHDTSSTGDNGNCQWEVSSYELPPVPTTEGSVAGCDCAVCGAAKCSQYAGQGYCQRNDSMVCASNCFPDATGDLCIENWEVGPIIWNTQPPPTRSQWTGPNGADAADPPAVYGLPVRHGHDGQDIVVPTGVPSSGWINNGHSRNNPATMFNGPDGSEFNALITACNYARQCDVMSSVRAVVDDSPPEVVLPKSPHAMCIDQASDSGPGEYFTRTCPSHRIRWRMRDVHSGVRQVQWIITTAQSNHSAGKVTGDIFHAAFNCTPASAIATDCRAEWCDCVALETWHTAANPGSSGLIPGEAYYVTLWVTNGRSLTTKVQWHFVADPTPVEGGVVRDGDDGEDVNYITNQTLCATWAGFFDVESGITDVAVRWVDQDEKITIPLEHYGATNLSLLCKSPDAQNQLRDGVWYYAEVQMTNLAGHVSIKRSNGVMYAPGPPVAKPVTVRSRWRVNDLFFSHLSVPLQVSWEHFTTYAGATIDTYTTTLMRSGFLFLGSGGCVNGAGAAVGYCRKKDVSLVDCMATCQSVPECTGVERYEGAWCYLHLPHAKAPADFQGDCAATATAADAIAGVGTDKLGQCYRRTATAGAPVHVYKTKDSVVCAGHALTISGLPDLCSTKCSGETPVTPKVGDTVRYSASVLAPNELGTVVATHTNPISYDIQATSSGTLLPNMPAELLYFTTNQSVTCDGGNSSDEVCATESQCRALCDTDPSCWAVEVHKTLNRCVLKGVGCAAGLEHASSAKYVAFTAAAAWKLMIKESPNVVVAGSENRSVAPAAEFHNEHYSLTVTARTKAGMQSSTLVEVESDATAPLCCRGSAWSRRKQAGIDQPNVGLYHGGGWLRNRTHICLQVLGLYDDETGVVARLDVMDIYGQVVASGVVEDTLTASDTSGVDHHWVSSLRGCLYMPDPEEGKRYFARVRAHNRIGLVFPSFAGPRDPVSGKIAPFTLETSPPATELPLLWRSGNVTEHVQSSATGLSTRVECSDAGSGVGAFKLHMMLAPAARRTGAEILADSSGAAGANYTQVENTTCTGGDDLEVSRMADQCYTKCGGVDHYTHPNTTHDCNGNVAGYDIGSTALCIDVAGCRALCDADRRCYGVAMHRTLNRCFLKTAPCVLSGATASSSYDLWKKPSQYSTIAQQECTAGPVDVTEHPDQCFAKCGNELLRNSFTGECDGNDASYGASWNVLCTTEDRCLESCDADEKCVGVQMHRSLKRCLLHGGACGSSLSRAASTDYDWKQKRNEYLRTVGKMCHSNHTLDSKALDAQCFTRCADTMTGSCNGNDVSFGATANELCASHVECRELCDADPSCFGINMHLSVRRCLLVGIGCGAGSAKIDSSEYVFEEKPGAEALGTVIATQEYEAVAVEEDGLQVYLPKMITPPETVSKDVALTPPQATPFLLRAECENGAGLRSERLGGPFLVTAQPLVGEPQVWDADRNFSGPLFRRGAPLHVQVSVHSFGVDVPGVRVGWAKNSTMSFTWVHHGPPGPFVTLPAQLPLCEWLVVKVEADGVAGDQAATSDAFMVLSTPSAANATLSNSSDGQWSAEWTSSTCLVPATIAVDVRVAEPGAKGSATGLVLGSTAATPATGDSTASVSTTASLPRPDGERTVAVVTVTDQSGQEAVSVSEPQWYDASAPEGHLWWDGSVGATAEKVNLTLKYAVRDPHSDIASLVLRVRVSGGAVVWTDTALSWPAEEGSLNASLGGSPVGGTDYLAEVYVCNGAGGCSTISSHTIRYAVTAPTFDVPVTVGPVAGIHATFARSDILHFAMAAHDAQTGDFTATAGLRVSTNASQWVVALGHVTLTSSVQVGYCQQHSGVKCSGSAVLTPTAADVAACATACAASGPVFQVLSDNTCECIGAESNCASTTSASGAAVYGLDPPFNCSSPTALQLQLLEGLVDASSASNYHHDGKYKVIVELTNAAGLSTTAESPEFTTRLLYSGAGSVVVGATSECDSVVGGVVCPCGTVSATWDFATAQWEPTGGSYTLEVRSEETGAVELVHSVGAERVTALPWQNFTLPNGTAAPTHSPAGDWRLCVVTAAADVSTTEACSPLVRCAPRQPEPGRIVVPPVWRCDNLVKFAWKGIALAGAPVLRAQKWRMQGASTWESFNGNGVAHAANLTAGNTSIEAMVETLSGTATTYTNFSVDLTACSVTNVVLNLPSVTRSGTTVHYMSAATTIPVEVEAPQHATCRVMISTSQDAVGSDWTEVACNAAGAVKLPAAVLSSFATGTRVYAVAQCMLWGGEQCATPSWGNSTASGNAAEVDLSAPLINRLFAPSATSSADCGSPYGPATSGTLQTLLGWESAGCPFRNDATCTPDASGFDDTTPCYTRMTTFSIGVEGMNDGLGSGVAWVALMAGDQKVNITDATTIATQAASASFTLNGNGTVTRLDACAADWAGNVACASDVFTAAKSFSVVVDRTAPSDLDITLRHDCGNWATVDWAGGADRTPVRFAYTVGSSSGASDWQSWNVAAMDSGFPVNLTLNDLRTRRDTGDGVITVIAEDSAGNVKVGTVPLLHAASSPTTFPSRSPTSSAPTTSPSSSSPTTSPSLSPTLPAFNATQVTIPTTNCSTWGCDKIASAADCNSTAVALGLQNATAGVSTVDIDAPEGCLWNTSSSTLLFNTKTTGHSGDSLLQAVCSCDLPPASLGTRYIMSGNDTTQSRFLRAAGAAPAIGGCFTLGAPRGDCEWVLEESQFRSKQWLVKSGSLNLLRNLTLGGCNPSVDDTGCEWAVEPAESGEDMWYIKAGAQYLRAADGAAAPTLGSCSRPGPVECLWHIKDWETSAPTRSPTSDSPTSSPTHSPTAEWHGCRLGDPVVPHVRVVDGAGPYPTDVEFITSTAGLQCAWSLVGGATDATLSIQWGIGVNPGSDDVVSFRAAGVSSGTHTLQHGERYYCSVVVTLGDINATYHSDGAVADLTLVAPVASLGSPYQAVRDVVGEFACGGGVAHTTAAMVLFSPRCPPPPYSGGNVPGGACPAAGTPGAGGGSWEAAGGFSGSWRYTAGSDGPLCFTVCCQHANGVAATASATTIIDNAPPKVLEITAIEVGTGAALPDGVTGGPLAGLPVADSLSKMGFRWTANDSVTPVKLCSIHFGLPPFHRIVVGTTTSAPTGSPSASPSTRAPSVSPTTSVPSVSPTTSAPSAAPTASPDTTAPTAWPTVAPTAAAPATPTSSPSRAPSTSAPTKAPSAGPAVTTGAPSASPMRSPTGAPTRAPSYMFAPTAAPGAVLTEFLYEGTGGVVNAPEFDAVLPVDVVCTNEAGLVSSPTRLTVALHREAPGPGTVHHTREIAAPSRGAATAKVWWTGLEDVGVTVTRTVYGFLANGTEVVRLSVGSAAPPAAIPLPSIAGAEIDIVVQACNAVGRCTNASSPWPLLVTDAGNATAGQLKGSPHCDAPAAAASLNVYEVTDSVTCAGHDVAGAAALADQCNRKCGSSTTGDCAGNDQNATSPLQCLSAAECRLLCDGTAGCAAIVVHRDGGCLLKTSDCSGDNIKADSADMIHRNLNASSSQGVATTMTGVSCAFSSVGSVRLAWAGFQPDDALVRYDVQVGAAGVFRIPHTAGGVDQVFRMQGTATAAVPFFDTAVAGVDHVGVRTPNLRVNVSIDAAPPQGASVAGAATVLSNGSVSVRCMWELPTSKGGLRRTVQWGVVDATKKLGSAGAIAEAPAEAMTAEKLVAGPPEADWRCIVVFVSRAGLTHTVLSADPVWLPPPSPLVVYDGPDAGRDMAFGTAEPGVSFSWRSGGHPETPTSVRYTLVRALNGQKCTGNHISANSIAEQCHTKCGTKTDGDCAGNPASGDASDPTLCATPRRCRELCDGLTACYGIDQHKTLPRCVLKNSGCSSASLMANDTQYRFVVKTEAAPAGLDDHHRGIAVTPPTTIGAKSGIVPQGIAEGVFYYVEMEMCWEADRCITGESDGLVVDRHPPQHGIVEVRGVNGEYKADCPQEGAGRRCVPSPDQRLFVQWTDFVDTISGVSRYEVSVKSLGGAVLFGPLNVGLDNAAEVHVPGLVSSSTEVYGQCYAEVRAVDGVGRATTVRSGDVVVETAPPSPPTGATALLSVSLTGKVKLRWGAASGAAFFAATDRQSGVRPEACIVRGAGRALSEACPCGQDDWHTLSAEWNTAGWASSVAHVAAHSGLFVASCTCTGCTTEIEDGYIRREDGIRAGNTDADIQCREACVSTSGCVRAYLHSIGCDLYSTGATSMASQGGSATCWVAADACKSTASADCAHGQLTDLRPGDFVYGCVRGVSGVGLTSAAVAAPVVRYDDSAPVIGEIYVTRWSSKSSIPFHFDGAWDSDTGIEKCEFKAQFLADSRPITDITGCIPGIAGCQVVVPGNVTVRVKQRYVGVSFVGILTCKNGAGYTTTRQSSPTAWDNQLPSFRGTVEDPGYRCRDRLFHAHWPRCSSTSGLDFFEVALDYQPVVVPQGYSAATGAPVTPGSPTSSPYGVSPTTSPSLSPTTAEGWADWTRPQEEWTRVVDFVYAGTGLSHDIGVPVMLDTANLYRYTVRCWNVAGYSREYVSAGIRISDTLPGAPDQLADGPRRERPDRPELGMFVADCVCTGCAEDAAAGFIKKDTDVLAHHPGAARRCAARCIDTPNCVRSMLDGSGCSYYSKGAESLTEASSDNSITCWVTAPVCAHTPTADCDSNYLFDITEQIDTAVVNAHWSSEWTNVLYLDACLGHTSSDCDARAWDALQPTATALQWQGLDLVDHKDYVVRVRGCSACGHCVVVTSDGFLVDSRTPAEPAVYPGPLLGAIGGQAVPKLLPPSGEAVMHWAGADEVVSCEWGIGESVGGTSVMEWSVIPCHQGERRISVNMAEGLRVYHSVKVCNRLMLCTIGSSPAVRISDSTAAVEDVSIAQLGIEVDVVGPGAIWGAQWYGFHELHSSPVLRYEWAVDTHGTPTVTTTLPTVTATATDTHTLTLPTATESYTLPTSTVTATATQSATQTFTFPTVTSTTTATITLPSATVTRTGTVTLPTVSATVTASATLPSTTGTVTVTTTLPSASRTVTATITASIPTVTRSATASDTLVATSTKSLTTTITTEVTGTVTLASHTPTVTAAPASDATRRHLLQVNEGPCHRTRYGVVCDAWEEQWTLVCPPSGGLSNPTQNVHQDRFVTLPKSCVDLLKVGSRYRVLVRAIFEDGVSHTALSDGVLVSDQSPKARGITFPATITSFTGIRVEWNEFNTDPYPMESPVVRYRVRLVSLLGKIIYDERGAGGDASGWAEVGLGTAYTFIKVGNRNGTVDELEGSLMKAEVEACNAAGFCGYGLSEAAVVATEPPAVPHIWDGSPDQGYGKSKDQAFTLDNTTVSFGFQPCTVVGNPALSKLIRHEYCVGTVRGVCDVTDWKFVNASAQKGDEQVSVTGLGLPRDQRYFANVKCIGSGNLSSWASSDGVLLLNPNAVGDAMCGTVRHGLQDGVSIKYQSSGDYLSAHWVDMADAFLGVPVSDYSAEVRTQDDVPVVLRTPVGAAQSVEWRNLSLSVNETYTVFVFALSEIGQSCSTLSEHALVIDATPPVPAQIVVPGVVTSGSTLGFDITALGSDPESGVEGVEVAIGSTPFGTHVCDYKAVAHKAGAVSIDSLSLVSGARYYVTLLTRNGAGLTAAVNASFETDFMPPAITVEARGAPVTGGGDGVLVTWSVADDRAGEIGVTVELLSGGGDQITKRENEAASGSVTFSIPALGSSFNARVRAVDIAGNQATKTSSPVLRADAPLCKDVVVLSDGALRPVSADGVAHVPPGGDDSTFIVWGGSVSVGGGSIDKVNITAADDQGQALLEQSEVLQSTRLCADPFQVAPPVYNADKGVDLTVIAQSATGVWCPTPAKSRVAWDLQHSVQGLTVSAWGPCGPQTEIAPGDSVKLSWSVANVSAVSEMEVLIGGAIGSGAVVDVFKNPTNTTYDATATLPSGLRHGAVMWITVTATSYAGVTSQQSASLPVDGLTPDTSELTISVPDVVVAEGSPNATFDVQWGGAVDHDSGLCGAKFAVGRPGQCAAALADVNVSWAADTLSPVSVTVDAGLHALCVAVIDGAGNQGRIVEKAVTVRNETLPPPAVYMIVCRDGSFHWQLQSPGFDPLAAFPYTLEVHIDGTNSTANVDPYSDLVTMSLPHVAQAQSMQVHAYPRQPSGGDVSWFNSIRNVTVDVNVTRLSAVDCEWLLPSVVA
eukprot:TRINITY_DN9859_c0_g4_i1.p1 TRINITY_DN9859_c0_g4~~TRINITY_DN9859_c0_g4_i1.p1  ORF type:complete len:7374 (+),score=1813.89 TRINITY_DN9859_c0_g4_i1:1778-22123(+)